MRSKYDVLIKSNRKGSNESFNIEVEASDIVSARIAIENKYPPEMFSITSILEKSSKAEFFPDRQTIVG